MALAAKHEIVATAITQRIKHGIYPPGSAIPSYDGLTAEFGCSRGTVRHAILKLKLLGLVDSRIGEGIFVKGRDA